MPRRHAARPFLAQEPTTACGGRAHATPRRTPRAPLESMQGALPRVCAGALRRARTSFLCAARARTSFLCARCTGADGPRSRPRRRSAKEINKKEKPPKKAPAAPKEAVAARSVGKDLAAERAEGSGSPPARGRLGSSRAKAKAEKKSVVESSEMNQM
eukprot:7376675-Prymnesium_polylepis.1